VEAEKTGGNMHKLLLAAVATAAISSPAAARDGSPYVGIEAGVLWPKDTTIDVREFDEFIDGGDIVAINYKKMGWDADLIAGYDFGMFRLEGELGYKRAKHDEYNANEGICVTGICGLVAAGAAVTTQDVEGGIDFDGDGSTRVWSLMANALLDVPIGENAALYVGSSIPSG
jgi:opacity protein-like surface antigen